MNALAYALAGCLVILAIPSAAADPSTDPGSEDGPDLPPYCMWFSYTLDPVDYHLNLACLLPPGP